MATATAERISKVTLVLTEFEAQQVLALVGNVHGSGKVREATDAVYYALQGAGVVASYATFDDVTIRVAS